MLVTLFTWLYITFLCWAWGFLFLQLLKRIIKKESSSFHFSIIAVTGLSVITIVAGILSLFIPLGQWWVQFIFIVPALSIFFKPSIQNFFETLKREFSILHVSSLILLSSLLLLILVMSTWTVIHPDTLSYHAQTIQWIEKYKAVPGLVHLHSRFGYQGLWFVDCALFDFGFTGKQGITFLNSTVLFWFMLFITNRIDQNFFKDGKKLYGAAWLGLLFLSLWSYTQIRLTVTSASPDFIATIITLCIIYILLEPGTQHLHAGDWLLTTLLSLVAVTIKLSAGPMLIIGGIACIFFLIKKYFKAFFICTVIILLTTTAFVTRNIITSGYIIFPFTAIDITNVDWKYSKERTTRENNYITAYAKKYGVSTKQEINQANNEYLSQWLPGWWQNRSLADKSIMILLLLSLLISVLLFRKVIDSGFIPLLIQITLLTGIIFWFINAPDPRFGFGFILGQISFGAYFITKEKEIPFAKNIVAAIMTAFTLLILAYTGYRFKNFYVKAQLITPLGISKTGYKTFNCGSIMINSPVNADFGIIPVPCTDLDCNSFSPRGNNIEDGFKAK